MADIFISYAHEDRARAAPLATLLEGLGLSVWWDPEIRVGALFAERIEAELKKASAIIVLWSPASVRSKWVIDEASFAAKHGKIVPILIDEVEPPIGFRQYQSLDFRDGQHDKATRTLLKSIHEHSPDLKFDASAPTPAITRRSRLESASRRAARWTRRRARPLAAIASVAFVGVLAGFALNGQVLSANAKAAALSRSVVAQLDHPAPSQIFAVTDAMKDLAADRSPASLAIAALLTEGKLGAAVLELESMKAKRDQDGAPSGEKARLLKQIGALVFRSDTQKALSVYREAYAIDPRDAVVLAQLGELHLRTNDPDAAYAYFLALDEVLRLDDQRPREEVRRLAINAKIGIGRTHMHRGRLDEAAAKFLDAQEMAQAAGAALEEAFALERLGAVAFEKHDLPAAQRYASQAAVIFRAAGDVYYEASALGFLGTIAVQLGDFANAQTVLREARELNRQIEDRKGEALNLLDLGLLALQQDQFADGAAAFREALAIADAEGFVNLQALLHENLADAAKRSGDGTAQCAALTAALATINAAPYPDAANAGRVAQAIDRDC